VNAGKASSASGAYDQPSSETTPTTPTACWFYGMALASIARMPASSAAAAKSGHEYA
jgi:hypothetical protein